jgi:NAD(P)-dependent dehydrogenase (short-subunit alcohol dehydrogenase family)
MAPASNPKDEGKQEINPPQHQGAQPGSESKMHPAPEFSPRRALGKPRLEGRVALITGGDSGIGRAVAVLLAREGADIAVSYLTESNDAQTTREHVEREGRRCILLPGDIRKSEHCRALVQSTTQKLGRLDILVNNAAEQHPQEHLEDLKDEDLYNTFATNIFAMFYLTRAALPWLRTHRSGVIINTASVTAYRGSEHLLDYSATKGAIVAFTRSLALQLAPQGVRVNAVAPGPVWTPLISSTFPEDKVATFGSDVPMGRPAQPAELAPAYAFLASEDASYITGQVLHVNGGEIING